jgi:hypothetical protein
MDAPHYTPSPAPPTTPSWLEADQQERTRVHLDRVHALAVALKRVLVGTLGLILLYILLFGGLPYSAGDPRNFLLRLDPAIQQILLSLILFPWAGVVGHLLILGYDFFESEILPIKCPRCRRIGNKHITRRAIPDTGRERLICARCAHTWYRAL